VLFDRGFASVSWRNLFFMPQTLTAARNAMATRFEMVLHGNDAVRLRAAADQAFHEVEHLHSQLSLYLPSSEVSFINARAAEQAVQVEPALFGLLQLAQRLHRETNGAFDITVAPLMRCWGFMGGSGATPDPARLEEARAQVGMQHVILEEKRRTIRFARPGMMIDLGSIGKGYALDVAVESLRESGIASGLVHGGTSTVYGMGAPPEGETWNIAIETPPQTQGTSPAQGPPTTPAKPLAIVGLIDEALSVSGVHGKCFTADGKTYGHVIDPHLGAPVQGALLAAVVLPSATESDALSTALLLAGLQGEERVRGLRPGMRTLVVEGAGKGSFEIGGDGIAPVSAES
jgi:thiamine biosynthesis lipoprotein